MKYFHYFLAVLVINVLWLEYGYTQPTDFRSYSENYICFRARTPITIDGWIDEKEWYDAAWTCDFQDIEGDLKPKPLYRTRVKMRWDDDFFYIAAELQEPHIWATYTDRDAVIFHENDFEMFIDPDGDTHLYYELEINALGTIWDLMLVKPYRDGGPAINSWNIGGLKKGIKIFGTINNPSDTDDKWTVELALPWEVLKEAASGKRPPQSGEQWRINFSRVNWQLETKGSDYIKKINENTGSPIPEYKWVWSPQGVIAMHRPETWGYVQFADRAQNPDHAVFIENRDESIKWALRQLYYRQHAYFENNRSFTADPILLKVTDINLENMEFHPLIIVSAYLFEITQTSFDGSSVWHIQTYGRVWITRTD